MCKELRRKCTLFIDFDAHNSKKPIFNSHQHRRQSTPLTVPHLIDAVLSYSEEEAGSFGSNMALLFPV